MKSEGLPPGYFSNLISYHSTLAHTAPDTLASLLEQAKHAPSSKPLHLMISVWNAIPLGIFARLVLSFRSLCSNFYLERPSQITPKIETIPSYSLFQSFQKVLASV